LASEVNLPHSVRSEELIP